MFSSLAHRDFMLLWLGMLFMMGGMQMQMLVRLYLVYDITESAKILGLVSAASALPILGLALFGGAFADRVDRKHLIQMGQWSAVALALFIGASISTGTVTWYHLLGAGMVKGVLWSFMGPARQAVIPELVGKDKLSNAVALNAAGMSVMTLAAPALAGVLYAVIGPEGVYYLVAALELAAVILTGSITRPAKVPRVRRSRMLTEIKEGLSYIGRNNLVLVLLVVGLASVLLAQPFRFLLPVFVVEIYHRESEAMGLLMSTIGLGSLVGSLYVASLGTGRRGLVLILASFASAIGLILVALVPSYAAAIGIMAILGLGEAGRRSLNQALVMELADDQYRGRVMSIFMMNFGLMPLGVLPAGLAIDLIGAQATVAVLGGLMLVTSTLLLVTQKRLRQLP